MLTSPAKILIVGDSPAIGTGMAEVIRVIFENLFLLFPNVYEIRQVGLFHIYAVTEPKWPIYPTKIYQNGTIRLLDESDIWGQKTLTEVVSIWAPDIVFYFNDPQNAIKIAATSDRSYKLIIYTNYDGIPFYQLDTCLGNADRLVTMSQFALEIFKHNHPSFQSHRAGCIYSPCDKDRFTALPNGERENLRSTLFPSWIGTDSIIIGWVGRNCWRKQVWIIYKIIRYLRYGGYSVCQRCDRVLLREWNSQFGRYECQKSGKRVCCCGSDALVEAAPLPHVYLWIHMAQDDKLGAWRTANLERMYGVTSGRDIVYTEGYGALTGLPPQQVGTLYQMYDMLLYLSGGEGFGIPVWEAMSCGVPVVYSDYSSHAELVKQANGGLAVGGTLQPQAGDCIERMVADISEGLQAIRKLIFDVELRQRLGKNGADYTGRFTVQTQVALWHSLFQSVLAEKSS